MELLKFNLVRVVAAVGIYYCSKMSEINELQRRKAYFGSWFVDLHLWSLGPLVSEPVVKPHITTDGVAEVNWSPVTRIPQSLWHKYSRGRNRSPTIY